MAQSENDPAFQLDHCCAVCLEALILSDADRPICALLPCGHMFHESCVGDWLDNPGPRSSASCPNCKATPQGRRQIIASDFERVDTTQPVYRHLKEHLRTVTREIDQIRSAGDATSARELRTQLRQLERDKAALQCLLARNTALSNIGHQKSLPEGFKDRNVLLQLAADVREECAVIEARSEKQRERIVHVNACRDATEQEVLKMQRLIARKRRELPAGQYDALKERAAERRRQRSASGGKMNTNTNQQPQQQNLMMMTTNTAAANDDDDADEGKPKPFIRDPVNRKVRDQNIAAWLASVRQKSLSPIPGSVAPVKEEPGL